jgi:ABC-type Mn2+/Zn2+ transport system ATPase subunit
MERPSDLSEGVLLALSGVSLGYGKRSVLREVEWTVARGDYWAIVGSNGSGKSTLLKAILGLVPPQAGRVQRAPGLHCGYVPQLQSLQEQFPLSVDEVVLMGRYGRLGVARRPRHADREAARQALHDVGLGELGHRLYRELSGGQKQRALIARALVGEPDLLILDEHTNDLDIAGERAVMSLLDELRERRHFTVVMVSHSINTVANHARSLGLIREGRISFAPADRVLEEGFLRDFYGLPLQVVEVAGRRVVV